MHFEAYTLTYNQNQLTYIISLQTKEEWLCIISSIPLFLISIQLEQRAPPKIPISGYLFSTHIFRFECCQLCFF